MPLFNQKGVISMSEKRTYTTPQIRKIEFDYQEVVVASGECTARFDDARWNSPGLALCGYKFTD